MFKLLSTLALGSAMLVYGPVAHADDFTMCPDGREGVVGARTTCDFAVNVRQEFYMRDSMPDYPGSLAFPVWSPVTNRDYNMVCGPIKPAHMGNGQTMKSVNCYGGDDAEVVVLGK